MMKVISFKICPFVQRVTALLEAKKAPYDIEYIDLSKKPDWFLDMSPNSQVPLLVTEAGKPLFESDAIAEYLDEVVEPLEPDIGPEDRAIDRAWSYQAAKNYLVQCSAQRSPSEEILTERAEKLGKAFERMEKVLGGGPFFKGERIGNVDISWLPLLHRADVIRTRTCYDFLKGYPKVQAWQAALMETGLPARSVPEDFEDVFSGFYLSDKTFLGTGTTCTDELPTGCKTDAPCCG
ncbi:MAG: glutathione S-transferase family protein [Verrucomicrobiota bacterium]